MKSLAALSFIFLFFFIFNPQKTFAACVQQAYMDNCSSMCLNGQYSYSCLRGSSTSLQGKCNGPCQSIGLNCPYCALGAWEGCTAAESNAICGGITCTPAAGICNNAPFLSCNNGGCSCVPDGCNGCNSNKNPQACCGDGFHYNCSWNSGSSTCSGPNPGTGSWQCSQQICNSLSDANSCNSAGGCSWTPYMQTNDGTYCATSCNGTCSDSCNGTHTCNIACGPHIQSGTPPEGTINISTNTSINWTWITGYNPGLVNVYLWDNDPDNYVYVSPGNTGCGIWKYCEALLGTGATSASLSNFHYYDLTQTDTGLTMSTTLLSSRKYWWRVIPTNCILDGTCNWPGRCSFTTLAGPLPGTIQGKKVLMPGNITPTTVPVTTVPILLDGGSPNPNINYSFTNVPSGNPPHTVSVTAPAGYTVGYTLCYWPTNPNCGIPGLGDAYHNVTPTAGNSVSVTVPASGYADLWWHFTLTATIRGYQVTQTSPTSFSYPLILPPSSQTVTLDGGSGTSAQPYSFLTTAVSHNVGIPIPLGYSLGYTICNSLTVPSCDGFDFPALSTLHNVQTTGLGCNNALLYPTCTQIAATVPTTPPAGGYTNLWFHFCNSWKSSPCLPKFGTCGPGVQDLTDDCGNTIPGVTCTLACSYFETFGGNVTAKNILTDYSLPANKFVCER